MTRKERRTWIAIGIIIALWSAFEIYITIKGWEVSRGN